MKSADPSSESARRVSLQAIVKALGFEEEPNTVLSSFIVMNTGVIQHGGGGGEGRGGGTMEAAPRRTESCDWSSADRSNVRTSRVVDRKSAGSREKPEETGNLHQIHLKTLRSDPPEDPLFRST
ncbi:hypothetical protein JOQ06_017710 [Pogonophryne albipinna]|uniref:Uncharacterized protein n=1 Tax=Pogonophryne albipinna TaxID=1090488 RepID=A0AAD6A9U9_9TELE|nr:hypothetical protein JOQ06_017710 [Pogonophryne albipinna]